MSGKLEQRLAQVEIEANLLSPAAGLWIRPFVRLFGSERLGSEYVVSEADASDVDSVELSAWISPMVDRLESPVLVVMLVGHSGAVLLAREDLTTHASDLWLPAADDLLVLSTTQATALLLTHEEMLIEFRFEPLERGIQQRPSE